MCTTLENFFRRMLMTIRDRLQQGPFLFDGAFGTYYPTVVKNPELRCEMANLNDPASVVAIHRAYLDAGAMGIRTNTFGANKSNLDCDDATLKQVIQRGIALAKEAIGERDIPLFADIGPIPKDTDEVASFYEDYRYIVDCFLEAGVEHFMFETMADEVPMAELAEYVREKSPEGYVLCSFESDQDGRTESGQSIRTILERLDKVDAIDALGLNCGAGPHHTLITMANLPPLHKSFSLIPNTGYPEVVRNTVRFPNNARYYTDKMTQGLNLGAGIIGGCCGTTPKHIADLAELLATESWPVPQKGLLVSTDANAAAPGKSSMIRKMERGEKVIAVEFDSPKKPDLTAYMAKCRRLKALGIDGITIADNPVAQARLDASVLACKIKQDLDFQAIPHLTCRDRNLNATKSLLLALWAEGVENVLIVTGDPVLTSDKDMIKSVFNFNSRTLMGYIDGLNREQLDGGFSIAGALNINAVNFDAELKKARLKEEHGLQIHFTQPVHSALGMANLKRATEELSAKVLGGLYPIVGHHNALFMANELSGMNVDPAIVNRYEGLSKEEASDLAVEFTVEWASEMADFVDGFYVITPFSRVDLIERIVPRIKSL